MSQFICRVCGGKNFDLIDRSELYCCSTCSTIFMDEEMFSLPEVKFKKLENKEYVKPIEPKNAHGTDTGYDLFSIENKIIKPGSTEMIKTGIAIQFPENMGAEIRPRSGLAYKHGIMVTNSPGTIDQGYRNEIRVLLYNSSDIEYQIKEHDKIAQLVFEIPISPVMIECNIFTDKTKRNLGGFGSTGKN